MRPPKKRSVIVALTVAAALLLSLWAGPLAAKPGSLDGGFGSGGVAAPVPDSQLLDVAPRRGGGLVAVGTTGASSGRPRMLVIGLNRRGRVDPRFHRGRPYRGPLGTLASSVAVAPNGTIVVAGTLTDRTGSASKGMLLERFRPNGFLDRPFGSRGRASALRGSAGRAYGVAVQRNGRILVAGSAVAPKRRPDAYPRVALARFGARGRPDRSFGRRGSEVLDFGRLSVAQDVVVMGSGKIVVAGSQRNDLQTTQTLVARLRPDGSPDTSFAHRGLALHQYARGAAYSSFNSLALQRRGRILLAGTALGSGTGADALLVRLTSRGSRDQRFGRKGSVYLRASRSPDQYGTSPYPGAYGLTISNGDVILAGSYDDLGAAQLAVWGLHRNGRVDRSFGDHGHTFKALPGAYSWLSAIASSGRYLLAAGQRLQPVGHRATGIVARYGAPRRGG